VSVQLAVQQQSPAIPQWQPPSNGRFKCNVDASFSDHFQQTGIGVCVRDDAGTFLLAKVQQFDRINLTKGPLLHLSLLIITIQINLAK